MKRFLSVLLILASLGVSLVRAAETEVQLLLPVETAKPGETILAGVRLKSGSGWHTYWKNPGESGQTTEIKWTLPAGVTAGEILWPAPEKLAAEGIMTYIYHGETVLFVPIKLASDLKHGPVELKANVSWLECMESCLPGEADLAVTLNIGGETKPSASAALLDAAQKKLPQVGKLAVTARWEKPAAADNTRPLLLEWPATSGATDAEFYPFAGENFEVQSATEAVPNGLRKIVKKTSGDWPKEISGTLTVKVGGELQTHAVVATLGAATPPPVKTPEATKGTTAVPPAPEPTWYDKFAESLIGNMIFALIGGILLNLMPCVLPILSLKVLSLVKMSGKDASVAKFHSLIYTLGVLASFWIVAGLVIAGRLSSWGEQFQDIRFIIVITTLMTLIALNLFGVFEFILPGSATNAASQLASREGASGAFFNGILAVVLGASCVAPVMAGAIGWAMAKTPVIILLIFTMLGLGLALPYVVLAYVPKLRAFMPKPGAWMEKFKIALGFPMLGMAAWTLSLVGDHFGSDGILWMGLFLVLLACALWIYGEFVQRGSKRKLFAAICALVCAGYGYGFALEHKLNWRHERTVEPANAGATTIIKSATDEIPWEVWSPEAVAKARAAGRPILVDFTANWCLTCQANKASSLEIDSVRKRLKEINAVSFLADFTKKNPAIAAELQRFGQRGVPMVLVYPKDATKPAEVLPTVLTPGIVLDALERAVK